MDPGGVYVLGLSVKQEATVLLWRAERVHSQSRECRVSAQRVRSECRANQSEGRASAKRMQSESRASEEQVQGQRLTECRAFVARGI